MTLPTSGPISFDEIHAEFGRGHDLGAYRNQIYYLPPDPTSRRFPSVDISVEDFYGTSPTSSGSPNTAVFGPGDHVFAVPYHTSMTIELWGGGGGGAAVNQEAGTAYGGNGGSYRKYSVVAGTLTAGSTEPLYVGYGGLNGSGYQIGYAGGYTQFGASIWVSGGQGGDAGTTGGEDPSVYTPTNPRPSVFTLITEETGGVSTNTVWAGAGGQFCFYSGGTAYYGGGPYTSTFGGNGGAAQALGDGVGDNGAAPGGGGGGGADTEGGTGGLGGDGRIFITWVS